jgi:hypothetical protein
VKWCPNFNSGQVVAIDNEGSGRPTTLAALQVDNLGKSRPDLALSDFHLFPTLKDQLSGHIFGSEDERKQLLQGG